MSIHLSTNQGARELINTLDRELKELAADMRANAGRIRIDCLWEIPMREAILVDSKKPIEVIPMDGIDATALAIELITNIWLGIGQNTRETRRAPGCIGLPSQWIERIKQTNLMRAALASLMKPLTQEMRTAIWRKHNGISSLQTLRKTVCLEDPISLRFYWDTSPSMKRTTVGEVRESQAKSLIETHGHIPVIETLPEGSLDRKIAGSVVMLDKLDSDEPIAIYRQGKPHIRARVKDGNNTSFTPASVPFVYDRNCLRPEIKPLLSYEQQSTNASRSIRAKIMLEPYIESMFIHRYLEQYRVKDTAK